MLLVKMLLMLEQKNYELWIGTLSIREHIYVTFGIL